MRQSRNFPAKKSGSGTGQEIGAGNRIRRRSAGQKIRLESQDKKSGPGAGTGLGAKSGARIRGQERGQD